jgi:hypothetical protein
MLGAEPQTLPNMSEKHATCSCLVVVRSSPQDSVLHGHSKTVPLPSHMFAHSYQPSYALLWCLPATKCPQCADKQMQAATAQQCDQHSPAQSSHTTGHASYVKERVKWLRPRTGLSRVTLLVQLPTYPYN